MKKKNGFTLVEIISVIALLLVIAAIAVPSIISINKRNKEKNYERIVESIKTSSENFIEEYRNDIPWNSGEYYFKLKVLGALNLIKLPIKDPRTSDNISDGSCVKVTKNNDGTLSYDFPADSCGTALATEAPTIEIDSSLAYVKKGNTVNLKDYVKNYGSVSTPKRYLKVITDPQILSTSNIGNKSVSYQAIDLLNGTVSTEKQKTFNIIDDPKINVIFLSDATTTTDLNSKDLNAWKSNLESQLTTNGPYKDIGIKYNINIETNSTISNSSTYELEQIGDADNLKGCTFVYSEYKGIFEDNVVVGIDYKDDCSNNSGIYVLVNINTGKRSILGDGIDDIECKYDSQNKENIYCHIADGGGSYTLNKYTYHKYYHYKLDDGKYEEHTTASYKSTNNNYDPTKSEYDDLKSKFENASDAWNMHSNPVGLETLSSDRDTKKIIENIADNNWTYYTLDLQNVFFNSNKGVGYLVLRDINTKYVTYTNAYMIWYKKNPETFKINVSNKPEYDRTYFVITSNNTNNYFQELEITIDKDNIRTYIYGDSNTLNNFNIQSATEKEYTTIDNVLNDLNNIIN